MLGPRVLGSRVAAWRTRTYSKPCQQQQQQALLAGWQLARGSKSTAARRRAARRESTPLDSDEYDEEPSINQGGLDDQQQQHQSTAQQQQDLPGPGGGFVGFFVGAWMGLLSLVLQLLSPVFSLGLFVAQPLTHTNPVRARAVVEKWATHLPRGFWARLHYLWERPVVKSIRITASIANWSVRVPAIAALLLAQGGALASTISFPMIAPLLLGTGMMMNSIKANASFIMPRLGLMVVLLWVLWFITNVIQTTWVVLCKQGRIDLRTLAGARMITECTSLLLAAIVVLSTLGINISGLLLPAGVVLAIASRDLLHNFIAGFFLVLAQPFRLGDKVAISCTAAGSPIPGSTAAAAAVKAQPGGTVAAAASSNSYGTHRMSQGSGQSTASSSNSREAASPPGWFEGICEKVDLRYTVLRDGRRRLMVPNTTFVSREFMVYDDGPEPLSRSHGMAGSSSSSSWFWQQKSRSPTPEQTSPTVAAASQAGSSGDRSPRNKQPAEKQQQAGSAAPEPAIVEGHMTTQVPPPGQPVFPGMHFAAYAPFPPMAYQQLPLQGYPAYPQDPLCSQQQQPEGVFGSGEWLQHQQHLYQQHEQLYQQLEQQQQQHGGEALHEHDGQQQPSGQASQQPQALAAQNMPRPVAKGPPGYLPQGFVGPQYWGIPVGTLVYGVPGMPPWGLGPGRPPAQPAGATPAQGAGGSGQQQPPQQPSHEQQQQQQGGPDSSSNSSSGSGGTDSSSSSRPGKQGGDSTGGRGAGAGPGSGQGGGSVPPAAGARHQPAGSNGSAAPTISSGQPGSAVQPQQQQPQPQHQRQPQQPPLPPQATAEVHFSSHSIHMAAAAGYGMWGMAPAGHPLSSLQQGPTYQPPYSDVGATPIWPYSVSKHVSSSPWEGPQRGYSQQQAARAPRASQEDAPVAAAEAPVSGRQAAAAAEAPAGEGDSQSNLVLAVLQEMSKQQF